MKNLKLSFVLLVLTACAVNPTKSPETIVTPTPAQVQAAKNCICVKIWMPVCGKDNKTYGNSCEAECAGVKYTQGACEIKK